MKNCSKCGYQNDDANAFCIQCGASFTSDEEPAPNAPAGSVPARPGNGLGYIRQVATSKIFLCATVLYSAMIVFNFLQSVTQNYSSILDSIYQILRESGYYYDLEPYVGSIFSSGMSAGAAILTLIPSIVIVIGLWLIYTSAKNINAPGPTTAGFTVLKVMNIISLVCVCVGFGLIDLALIVLLFSLASGAEGSFVAVMLILLVICTAVLVLLIVYYRKILGTIKLAVMAIQTGNLVGKPSMYLIVWNFIMAFTLLFSLFTTGLWGFLSTGSNLAFMIIISVMLLKVKKDIEIGGASF